MVAAMRLEPGDAIWYRGRRHIIKDVDGTGGFGFRGNGPCAPYLGLAGVETLVTKGGRRSARGKLIELGVKPEPYYTEMGGEVIGWVSYLVCEIEKGRNTHDRSTQRLVWWCRTRTPRQTLSAF